MVRRLLRFFSNKEGGLHEAAYLLAFFTILNQLLSFLRDRMLAHQFGAGLSLDLYYSAFRIPDVLFISIGSLVSISVLVPYIIEKLGKKESNIRIFIDELFWFFGVAMVLACISIFFAMPLLLKYFFPLLYGEDPQQFLFISRVLLLSPFLLGLSNFFGGILQAMRRFFVYSIAPLLYNIGIIVGILVFYPRFGLSGLAYGVILGALLHLLIQIPFVIREGLMPRIRFFHGIANIREVISLSMWRTIALSTQHVALFILVAMAARMLEGSVSVFNFSFNLQSALLSVVAVSYSLAAFPTLSRLYSTGSFRHFVSEVEEAAKHIIFWSVPGAILFVVLRAQIVRTVLGSGYFSWDDTRLTAAALALFAVSLGAQGLVLLLTRSFYAAGETTRPLLINIFWSIAVVVLAYVGMAVFKIPSVQFFSESLLRLTSVSGNEIIVLPLAFSLAMIGNALSLWFFFARRFSGFSRSLYRTLFEVLGSSIVMGYVTYEALRLFDDVVSLVTLFGVFFQGFTAGVLGIFSAIGLLMLLKNKEIVAVWRTLHHKIWKAKPIAAEPEGL